MQNVKAMDGNIPYIRISKVKAKKLYEAGKPIVLCPCKLYPFGGFRPSMTVEQRDNIGRDETWTFDYVVQNFQWYNCNYEAGYYAAFYVQEGNK